MSLAPDACASGGHDASKRTTMRPRAPLRTRFETVQRLCWILVVAWTACPAVAQDPPPAGPEEKRVQALVEAGVLPENAIQQARGKAERKRLEQVVRETLMSGELTEGRLPEMMRAVAVLREMSREDLAGARKLAEAGALPLQQLKKVKEAADWGERQYELAEQRSKLVREMGLMARAEDRLDELEEEDLAFSSEVAGGSWEEDALAIDAAFFSQFGQALPISARGETEMHRSMGFDHAGRLDVAVHPDDEEGIFLIELLYEWEIPFIAFRSSVPGQSTGPHIHIGPRSDRVVAEDPAVSLP